MILCDDGHTEVCYDRGLCPVCAKIEEIEALQERIDELNEEIRAMEA